MEETGPTPDHAGKERLQMTKETQSGNPMGGSILDLSQPVPEGAEEFKRTMSSLLDGKEKDEETVERAFEGQDGMFDLIAAKLYSIASMLVGEGEESIQLVETSIADSEVTCCQNAAQAGLSS